MSRLLFFAIAALVTVAQLAPVSAQPKADPAPKPAPTLKVGDPLPPLKVSKWLRGDDVKQFERGHVYVVEFWATWCGPCIAAMPHLADIQAEYKQNGVTVIGFTSRDLQAWHDQTEKDVAEFMARRGKAFAYTFAYADDGETTDAWLKAAGRNGIPCSFVVDKSGRLAYIGHPMYLGAVLPKVVEGKATAKEIGDAMTKMQGEFNDVSGLASSDPKACLQALKRFEAKYPAMADFILSVRIKLSLMPKSADAAETKEYAEALVAKATKKKDLQTLGMVSAILRRGDGKESKELLAVAVKATEAEVQIDGGKNPQSLIDLADAYFVVGDKAKAKEYADKAVVASKGEPAAFKEYVEKEAARLGKE